MSLVNDMLKDLDARRRGAPVKGNAAKKLTPASDRRGLVARSHLPLLAGLFGIVVIVVLILWLLLGDRGNSGELADLRSRMNEASSAVDQQDLAAAQSSAASNNDAATIAALEARLAELEAANGAGAALRNGSNAGQANDWNPVDWSDTNPAVAQAGPANTNNAVNNTATGSASATVSPGTSSDTQTVIETQLLRASAEQQRDNGTAVARQAREMPLSERDRLQVQEALTLWSQGQQLTALQLLDSFAFENPEAHQSRETLAKLLIRQGEVERALQAAELGLQIAPSHPGYKKVKARILLNQSDVTGALAVLSASPPTLSNDPEYHSLLATAQLAGGEYNEAIQSYRELLRLNDPRIDKAPLWYGLGSAQQRIGNAAEARQAYQQALQQPELSPNLRAQIERRMAAPASVQ